MRERRQLAAGVATDIGLDLPPHVLSLAVAATFVFDKRPSEIGVRESVLLLYVVDGDIHMRSHNGTVYMYSKGTWTPFTGLVSDYTMVCVKTSMLNWEGVFRLLPPHTTRAMRDVLREPLDVLASLKVLAEWFS